MQVVQRWYECRDVGDGVLHLWEPHVHPFARCNIWYVRGRDHDLLIDAGTGLRPLLPELQRISGQPIIGVATHIHFDHVGALHEFSDRRAHFAEAAHYSAMPDGETLAPLFRDLRDPVTALPHEGWCSSQYRVPSAPIEVALKDLDVIDLGDRQITVLHLPGHSPGSVGFFDARNGLLFSGDALYDGELIDNFDSSDIASYRRTMERLRDLDIRTGHGGHCSSFDNTRKRRLVEDYLAGRRRQGCPTSD
jgi:glyoxylase-like metal-dependent hydrolase (beta-lactamase superfamily II)